MSVNTAVSESSIVQRLNQLEAEVSTLRDENESLKERNSELENRVSELEELESEQESEPTELHEVELGSVPVGRLLSTALSKSSEATDAVAELRSSQEEVREPEKPVSQQSPIQAYSAMKQSGEDTNLSPSKDRAVTIFDNFRRWGKKTMAGFVLSSGLKNLLSAKRGESLSWKQVHRSAQTLAEESAGAITWEKRDRQGWCLVAEKDTLSPSSAGKTV